RGDLPQDELRFADHHRVPRIGTALVAHDQVRALGEHIHQFALALIAPLGTHHHDARGALIEHWSSPLCGTKKEPLAGARESSEKSIRVRDSAPAGALTATATADDADAATTTPCGSCWRDGGHTCSCCRVF